MFALEKGVLNRSDTDSLSLSQLETGETCGRTSVSRDSSKFERERRCRDVSIAETPDCNRRRQDAEKRTVHAALPKSAPSRRVERRGQGPPDKEGRPRRDPVVYRQEGHLLTLEMGTWLAAPI